MVTLTRLLLSVTLTLFLIARSECVAAAPSRSDAPVPSAWRLGSRTPATRWVEALPLGNGRLGAMVFGGPAEERLQLNESTVWTGKPHSYQHEGAVNVLPEIRK